MNKEHYIDQLFDLVRQDQPKQTFQETAESFSKALKNPGNTKTITRKLITKKWWIMLSFLSSVALLTLTWLFLTGDAKKMATHPEKKLTTATTVNSTRETPREKAMGKTVTNSVQDSKTISLVHLPARNITRLPNDSPPFSIIPQPLPLADIHNQPPPDSGVVMDAPYIFPKLTEAEISTTLKKKKAMLKALQKYDKKAYSYVPAGSFQYQGQTVSVQGFCIGVGEVTNLEYRTFLFDLLIQGRKKEFLTAKPNQSAWLQIPVPSSYYQEHYFSDEAFNDYPVVNISRDGAELYCKWLTEELWKHVGPKHRAAYNPVRIPLRVEWVKAASCNGTISPYSWNGNSVQNAEGLFQANCIRSLNSNDTLPAHVHGKITAPVLSFWPNELGLYNTCGNVAEMVYDAFKRTNPGTAGGSWASDEKGIQIDAPDPYPGITEGMPTLGFRVVITILHH